MGSAIPRRFPRAPPRVHPRLRLFLAITCCISASAGAQSAPDLIRGRVTDDSARIVAGASIHVTRGPDRAVKQTTTDSSGNYQLEFENGTGDYLVAVSGAGLKSARRRLQRQGTERELVADFVLAHDLSTLAAVKVTADKPVKATADINPYNRETGASEKWADGVEGQLPPALAGDLNALAGTMSNITVGPGGLSMLGASSESNLTTLNGMSMPAGSLPRAARVNTRVTGATFDPTRGGFSGANIDAQLGPGSRSYQQRDAYFTINAPALQYTDAVGRSSGARTGSFRGSASADGELIRRALTYNVSVDYLRSSSDPATLFTGDAASLARAGVAPDSVTRLLGVARPFGLALAGGGIPVSSDREVFTWLGRLDDTRDSLNQRTLTTYVTSARQGAIGFAPLASPSTGGEQTQRTYGLQLVAATYFGEGLRALNTTKFSANQSRTEVSPYLDMPGATVLVRSATDGATDVASLALGGASYLANDDRRTTVEASNETIWTAGGRRHKFKAFLWGRFDGLQQQGGADLQGRYTFNSIGDLAANTPSSYSRTINQPERSGQVWNGAMALAHQWAPSRWFSMLYGARVEADGFASGTTRNTALEQALGISTDAPSPRLHVSPRVGFSWTYNRDKDNGNGSSSNDVGRFYRNTSGVIRGGIGEFRDLLRPGVIADARSRTGLAGSALSLNCVGAATPTPDWLHESLDVSTLPTQCLDGSGPLGDTAPSVSLIDRTYDVPRSWRAALDWNGNVGVWMIHVGGLGSYDLSQPGTVDANFAGTPQFALAGEGGRPVFVPATSIDPASGTVSPTLARRAAAFGRVAVATSDLRGYGGQLTINVGPDPFRMRGAMGPVYFSLGYTLQSTRREYRGFDGAGFGDPRVKEWAPSMTDARHVFTLQGGVSGGDFGTLTLFARAQSGLPFTPVVQGDPNGDGRSGDRAFVPNAATETDPALAQQLKSLIANGSAEARACLQAFAGRVADRNGCRGPWTTSLNAQWKPYLPSALRRRLQASVYFENVLGGIDQMLHGNDLRGWGTAATPDPVLLVPRSFDAAANRFRYDVNPKFADTRPASTLNRAPFRITLDFSLRLSVDYDLQELRRALEPVKVAKHWERRSADSLAAFYLSNTSDIYKLLLEESDSLFLSGQQIAAIRRADSVFSSRVRGVYVPLGQYLSQFSDGVPTKAALDSAQATDKAYWKVFWEQPEMADSLITPMQRELLPLMKNILTVPKKEREHSQWQFGHPVTLKDEPRRGTAPTGGR